MRPKLDIPPDQFEPNDDSSIATQLRTVSGSLSYENLSISYPGDVDMFRFTLLAEGGADDHIAVEFADVLGDVDITLYSVFGDFIASSNGVGNREFISLAGLGAGDYELSVFGYFGDTNPNYSLSISGPNTGSGPDRFETNNTRESATNLREVGSQTFVGLSIDAPGDEDWFRFETSRVGQAGHSIDLAFLHSQGDVDIKLYDASGAFITGSGSTRNEESISLQDLAAGVYYLQVYGYAGAVNPAYALAFHAPTADQLSPDRFESNNTLASASLLRTAGETLAGSLELSDLNIATATDVDFYQFNTVALGSAANVATITYPRGSGNLRLDLLDSAGQVIDSSTSGGGSESVALDGLQAGRYYLKVSGNQADARNEYRLRIDAPSESSTGQLDAWTIMVYMTASDLAEFAFQDINEMEEALAGLPGSVNIAVLWDQSANENIYATAGGAQAPWSTLGQAFIQPDTNSSSVARGSICYRSEHRRR